MLQKIRIQNFKSIVDDTLELGRVNVFIGENGSGKSNILEAIAYWSAFGENRITNDNLISKGVRITKPALVINSFKEQRRQHTFSFEITSENENEVVKYQAENSDDINSEWFVKFNHLAGNTISIDKILAEIGSIEKDEQKFIDMLKKITNGKDGFIIENNNIYENFLIYCINTPALRGLTSQSHKDPIGIFGEGLDVLMANFDKEERAQLAKYSYMIDWLEDFMLDTQDVMKLKGYKLNRSKSTLYFSDKYMAKKNNVFSSENANEGILHVLFYLSVLISKRTPKFFAIDNIESCLNPHLCRHLMMEICQLAKETDKQLMITTHNPAILDGLNLFDDEVRLFEVKRNEKGHTVTRRIKIKPDTDLEKYKISELWTRGYLGAIAENF